MSSCLSPLFFKQLLSALVNQERGKTDRCASQRRWRRVRVREMKTEQKLAHESQTRVQGEGLPMWRVRRGCQMCVNARSPSLLCECFCVFPRSHSKQIWPRSQRPPSVNTPTFFLWTHLWLLFTIGWYGDFCVCFFDVAWTWFPIEQNTEKHARD